MGGAVKPAVSPLMIANTSAASDDAPSTVPTVSTLPALGSALSGSTIAPAARTASPNVTSNQKMPRQLQSPTSSPPSTGPSASEKPETAAQTPSARFRLRSSA